MDKRIEFAKAFDRSIALVQKRISNYDRSTDPLPKKNLEFLLDVLKHQKQRILTQDIEPYQGQLFVPVKEVIDWGEPVDSDLLDSIHQIQVFYEQNY